MNNILAGLLGGGLMLIEVLAFIIGLYGSVPSNPNINNSSNNNNDQIEDDQIGFKCEPTSKK